MVHHGANLAGETGDHALAEAVASGRFEGLGHRLRALLAYAVALTVSPRDVQRTAVEALEGAGLTAREIIDANQVVAYFNYVNRIADGLGVELEDSWPPEAREPRHYPLTDFLRPPPARDG